MFYPAPKDGAIKNFVAKIMLLLKPSISINPKTKTNHLTS